MSPRLKSLIELYHASTRFPNRQNMLKHIDASLLGTESLNTMGSTLRRPEPLGWKRILERETQTWKNSANRVVNASTSNYALPDASSESRSSLETTVTAADRPSLAASTSSTSQSAASRAEESRSAKLQADAALVAARDAWKSSDESASASLGGQAKQRERLQRIRDALHGTSAGGNAGLPWADQSLRDSDQHA